MNGTTINKTNSNIDADHCSPYDFQTAGFASICQYVQNRSDICEGGGYLFWTQLKVCSSQSTPLQVLILVAALVFFLFLFLHLSTTADSFFCKNIASIVDLHQISQNIAGITFMAFGNGAPDIFSSIASVTSVSKPRADLAISELLGGGIFVTSCVIAAIALSKPFLLMRRPILRDISFYLGALLLLVLVANWDGEMPLWQPLAFLLLYLIYAITVVSGNLYYQRTSQKTTRRNKLHRAIARLVPKKVAPTDFESEGKKVGELILTAAEEKAAAQKSTKNADNILHLPGGILVIPITEEDAHLRRALDCLEAGKFFGKEELDAEQSYAAEDNESMSPLPLMHMHGGISRVASPFPDASVFGEQMRLFWCLLAPLDTTKFRNSTWPGRIYRIAKMPSMLLLRLTVPCACQPWSKPLAVVHAFLAPLILCAAFHCLTMPLTSNSVLLVGELAAMVSFILSILVIMFTNSREEPTNYKWVASYAGFFLSIAWIYATAAEVLNVVLMFGNLFHIPYQILGLTAISWCNSIGDLVADISVAKQGMSRMAFSAAIGAPLFNLMVGFGSTFTIAKIQGKAVDIKTADPVNNVMFSFLGLSLFTTMILLFVQKFYVRKFHGLILILLYLLFLLFVIPTGSGISIF